MGYESMTLPDGRTLEYWTGGPEDGLPLVFHGGTPDAAKPPRFIQRASAARGLRLVAISRPGYGASTRRPGRRVVDIVDDTAAVLGSIGAPECVVAGWSGGGPHALACAARLSGVRAALLIAGVGVFGADGLDFLAGMGQDNLDEFGAALEGEEPLRRYLETLQPELVGTTADGLIETYRSILPPPDREVLTDEFGEDLAESISDAVQGSVDGWLDDDLAFTKGWGFALDEVRVPVTLWQGSEDGMVPFAHGRWLAERLPTAHANLLAGEGHLSVAIGKFGDMLDALLARAS